MKLKEAWRRFSRAQVDTFLRSGHEGLWDRARRNRPAELRIHPRQGTSDPRFAWGGRPNVVYEVLRAAP